MSRDKSLADSTIVDGLNTGATDNIAGEALDDWIQRSVKGEDVRRVMVRIRHLGICVSLAQLLQGRRYESIYEAAVFYTIQDYFGDTQEAACICKNG